MIYFDAVVLSDKETYTGVYGSTVILNATEDEALGTICLTKESHVIPIEELIDAYKALKGI